MPDGGAGDKQVPIVVLTVAVFDHGEKRPVYLKGASTLDEFDDIESEAEVLFPDTERFEHQSLMGVSPDDVRASNPWFRSFPASRHPGPWSAEEIAVIKAEAERTGDLAAVVRDADALLDEAHAAGLIADPDQVRIPVQAPDVVEAA
jgi:hypothetical protein